ncbi:MAG TPA: hypothetical protein VK587_07990 [bacterium]|nr:hypothetical protein [bacterium]
MDRACKRRVAALIVIAFLAGAGASPGLAQISLPSLPSIGGNTIGAAIKLFGIGYVVKTFGPQINSAINTLMLNSGAANKELTKVVPIVGVAVTIGGSGGGTIGAAQVQGPKADLDQVQAVAQVTGSIQNVVTLKALIPVNSLTPLPGKIHRVYGVGVTALVDFNL